MGKILAIDYGEKRIGLAVTDDMKMIAFGLTTVNTPEIFTYLSDYIPRENVDVIVVGEPKQMDNTASESEVHIAPFLVKLAEKFPTIPIKRHDERFTSKMAFQTMLDSGLKKKQRKNKALIDEISATIILQDFLKTV
ncbi:Holliday junction resolvase RuvX [Maribacter sp. SA7]|uniref:Holliday junction resolvase RuvX n=1 Tax=Maribacter zhoushanensis TaxID=3030012 RepID=UPI0023ED6A39|nr:Holliday junction resolvase RuvX [Maribacter zhoushanensis]MDF4202432.1 Holliday junction resolvase RuvX [Maribacter zhoushanensis]